MRYLEGGKLTKDQTNEYLVHCENVIKNAEPHISKLYLLDKLREYAKSVTYTNFPRGATVQLNYSIDLIFANIDETEPDLLVVNAASLQLSVLFTYASMYNNDWVEPALSDFGNNNNIYQAFKRFTGNAFVDILNNKRGHVDWRIYKNIKLLFDWNQLSNGIITILDYLTLDQVIVPYLNEWFICGLVYDKTYADGKLMVPFEFVCHDIIHYSNYNHVCLSNMGHTPTELLAWYEYICTLPNAYAVKVIFFMLIHESGCNWKNGFDMQSSWSWGLALSRLLDDNDLGLLIPKKHRDSDETRIAYLETAATAYNDAITVFFLPPEHGGRKNKNKKVKKTKRSKTKGQKQKRSKTKGQKQKSIIYGSYL